MYVYMKIASHYNIVDKPNERSSHFQLTIRGGGIIFTLGVLYYFFASSFSNPYFVLGTAMVAVVGFLDDLSPLSNKTRLIIHFSAVLLLLFQASSFSYSWFLIPIFMLFIVASLNSYNFMDGINGITAFYSLSVIALLHYLNLELAFIDQDLIVYTEISLLIFTFYNARKKAKCFAGDTGSLAIGYILFFLTIVLMHQTENPFYALFFLVYGIDTAFTLLFRLIKKENIYKAHRSHLYQYLANETKISHLLVALFFAFAQLLVGILIIYFSKNSFSQQLISSSIILISSSLLYLAIRRYIVQKYVNLN